MMKLVRGKSVGSLGEVEKKLTINWTSLVISIGVAVLTWGSTELVPDLQEYGGVLGSAAGLISMVIPILLSMLRNNSDVTVEKKI